MNTVSTYNIMLKNKLRWMGPLFVLHAILGAAYNAVLVDGTSNLMCTVDGPIRSALCFFFFFFPHRWETDARNGGGEAHAHRFYPAV